MLFIKCFLIWWLKVVNFFLENVLLSDSIGIWWVICLNLLSVVLLIFCDGELGFWNFGLVCLRVFNLCIKWLYLVLGMFGVFSI